MSNKINSKIRIGTRTSRLALAQVAEIHLLLANHFPNIQIEIFPINTSGDKIIDQSLTEIGGKGLFIKELEEALLQNKIDIAVHSAKDIPPIINDQTIIGAFSPRLDPSDCFISAKYSNLNEMPKGAVIGTSSPRRKAIILNLRPDLKIVNFRGNVDTRLNKALEGQVDACILASSGIARLGKEQSARGIIEISKMIPAGGQGALAIQISKDNQDILKIIQKINDQQTYICVQTERAFLKELGASCNTPVGVYANIKDKKLYLQTIILDYNGKECFKTNGSCKDSIEDGIELATAMAKKTKIEAQELLKKIISNFCYTKSHL